jgi:hypothetical protein
MSEREIMRGITPVGGRQSPRPNRRYEVLAKDFTSVEQDVPVRLIYGTPKPFAGAQVTPIFGFRNEAVQAESGKGGGKGGSGITGYNYWGSDAIVVGLGPIHRLNKITNGDTEIWSGPVDISSSDVDGKTTLTTTLGTIHFYWGHFWQNPDPLLQTLTIDLGAGPVSVPTPAWRNVAYAVCSDLAFGQQVAPPTLLFHGERWANALPISAHEINGDAVVPEVIYDLLVNELYGAGAVDEVDADNFAEIAEITIAEGLGCSPDYDSTALVREMVGQLLSYIDAYLYIQDGKIRIGLFRQASTVGLPEIGPADLLEEPEPNPTHFEETWNKTVVSFNDRDYDWDETSEDYEDPANAAIVGETVRKTFHFPFVTNRGTAKRLAKLLGIRGGLPTIFWDLVLKPRHRTLLPGDRFVLNYDLLGVGSRVVRVKSVEVGGPAEPQVRVTVQEEQTRSEEHDYQPPEDNFTVPGTLDPNGTGAFGTTSTTPRLAMLPTDLKDGMLDGVLVACDRPDAMTIKGTAYWTWDPGAQGYSSLGTFASFPAKGTLVCWHKVRTTNWLFRIQMASAADYDLLQTLEAGATDLYAVVVGRLVKTVGSVNDEHQVTSIWLAKVRGGRFELVSDAIIDIELEGAAFASDDLMLETAGDDGLFPCLHVYVGRREDFFIYTTNTLAFDRNLANSFADLDKERYIKVPVGNHVNEESLSDVTAVTYDRDDTTMSPNGTFSREWGDAATTGYELVDVEAGAKVFGAETAAYDTIEDLDEALGALAWGTATVTQELVAEHIDTVLGSMAWDGHLYYNE